MLQAFADCSEKGLIDKIGITCFAIFVELIKVYEFLKLQIYCYRFEFIPYYYHLVLYHQKYLSYCSILISNDKCI